MTPEEIRRAVASLDLDARRAVVAQIGRDMESTERVLLGAELMSFRLGAAWSKRWAKRTPLTRVGRSSN